MTAPDVAHALEDRVKARPPDALDDRNPRQQPDRDQGRGEGRDVEAVRARERPKAAMRTRRPRAGDVSEVEDDVLDDDRGRQLLGRNEPG